MINERRTTGCKIRCDYRQRNIKCSADGANNIARVINKPKKHADYTDAVIDLLQEIAMLSHWLCNPDLPRLRLLSKLVCKDTIKTSENTLQLFPSYRIDTPKIFKSDLRSITIVELVQLSGHPVLIETVSKSICFFYQG